MDWGWGGNGQLPPWYNSIREDITNIIVGDGITTIGFYAFIDCVNALSVNIGKDVNEIKIDAFWNCPSIREIHSNNPTPPVVDGNDAFLNLDRTACEVYVPDGAQCAYAAASDWKDFNIIGATFSIIPSAGSGEGSISPNNTQTVNCGGNQSFTFTPNTGYQIDYVLVNGSNIGSVNNYTFENVNADQSIRVFFKANTYTVTYNGNGNTEGSTANSSHTYDVAKDLTCNGFARVFTVTYNYNENGQSNTTATATSTFAGWAESSSGSIKYDDCQNVEKLTSTDGATVTLYAKWNDGTVILPAPTRTGYTFAGWYTAVSGGTNIGNGGETYIPAATITLYAQWIAITFTVSTSSNPSAGGSINGDGTYSSGSSCTVTAKANSDYTFYNWTENGSEVSTNAGYTFTVSSDRNLVANFKSNDATLRSLSINPDTLNLNPAFNANIKEYTVHVTNNDSCITINAIANNSAATVNGIGKQSVSVGVNKFDIEVIAEDGTKITYSVTVNRPTGVGVENISANQLTIYPNPAKSEIFIKTELPIKKIEICDMSGRIAETWHASSLQNDILKISVSSLSKGIYMVRVYTDSGLVTEKVVKE